MSTVPESKLPESAQSVTSAADRSAADTALNDPAVVHVFRRTLIVAAIAQAFGGAGIAAGIVVGALLAKEMLNADSWAGIPVALFTAGSAASAYLVGRLSGKSGRRVGLAAGFGAGALGAVGVVAAAVWASVPLLFISLVVYGAGTASNLQTRYAGTDLAPANKRATAVSIALVATTFGAVAGPNLVRPTGAVASWLGFPVLTGPFLLAAVAYVCAGATIFFWMRPDPSLLAREIAGKTPTAGTAAPSGGVPSGVLIGATVMVLTQIAMVAIMTMTP
ncbi:MAG: MFS transporter, partial [Rhodococcus sp.]|nr:MFS transporter [Rhodococcus sp. (in: high G+C Gram-positive bacteria)]